MKGTGVQLNGPLAAVLLMCLLLGVALATGVDALTSEDDISEARWFFIGASVLALTAAIFLFDRYTQPRQ
jgi:hypothetical protein